MVYVEACNRVRQVRESRGMTRTELAQRAGVRYGTLAQMEMPTRSLRGASLRKLAAALECDPRDLVA